MPDIADDMIEQMLTDPDFDEMGVYDADEKGDWLYHLKKEEKLTQ